MAVLGGLNLAALAQGAGAETDMRIGGANANLAAALQSMLAEQHAGILAQSQGAERGRTHDAWRAQLDEALARREANMQAAQQQARLGFEAREADLARQAEVEQQRGVPDWFTQERFRTDENIRQAKALAAMEAEAQAAANRPRLSDFGNSTVNPFRGQALLDAEWGKKSKVKVGPKTREIARPLIEKHGMTDPDKLFSELQKKFKAHGNKADEIASIALWQLGYLGPAAAG